MQQKTIRSGTSMVTFNSINSSASVNTNDIYSILHFPGRTISFFFY